MSRALVDEALVERAFNVVREPGGTVWYELGERHKRHLVEMCQWLAEQVSA